LIRIQRKPLFKPHPLFVVFFVFCSVVFFCYATICDNRAFVVLLFGFAGCLCLLLPLQRHFSNTKRNSQVAVQNYHEEINLLEIDINKQKAAIASCREKIVNYFRLKEVAEKLSTCLSLDEVARVVSSVLSLHFGQHVTIILYLFHAKTGELGISFSHRGRIRVNIKAKQGDVFDQWVARTMQSLLVEDARNDFRFDFDFKTERRLHSLISVPLIAANKALGILRVDSPRKAYFSTEDLRFLTTVGDLSAVAIENTQLYLKFEQLAIRDSLTGLYLKHYCLKRLSEEVARHIRSHRSMAFIMMDLDNFKQYNDRYGHIAGDIVLKAVGKVLLSFAERPGVLVCRYGGEEFCLLITECRQDTAVRIAEQIRKSIEYTQIVLRRKKTRITVSIGLAMLPKDAKTVDDLIYKADIAMYKAKERGKNMVCLASRIDKM